MSKTIKGVFGGTDDSAQKSQEKANVATSEFVKKQAKQSRSDVLGLTEFGDTARNKGFQGALDVLAQTIPQQLSAFSQGNIAAQGTTLAGADQFRNAILGGQVDLSQFNPQGINVPAGIFAQQLPEFDSGINEVRMSGFAPDINEAYRQTLGRDADPEGLAFFTEQLAKGGTIGNVRDALAGSQEGRTFAAEAPQRQDTAFRSILKQLGG